MNSRQRVRAVLNHEMPDRVPNGWGGCETAGVHMVAYDKLRELLGVNDLPTRLDTFMVNAVFEEVDIKAMDGDILLLASPGMCASPLRGDHIGHLWKQQQLWNGKTYRVPVTEKFTLHPDSSIQWNNAICPKDSYYFDSPNPTDMLADVEVPSPEDFHPRDTFSDEMLRSLENAAKKLYETTEFSLSLGECITDLQVQPGGYISHLILMKEEPELMTAFLDKCVEASLKQIALLEEAVGKYVDILCVAHDFGDSRGVTIGAETWREVYKPCYKKWFQGWHKATNMKINLHSCGTIIDILPDLIECGLDIYNPVQYNNDSMTPDILKEAFGKDLVFYGGAYHAQMVSSSDSYDKIYEHVYNNIMSFKKGGGYIMAGVHNLPGDLPKSHIQAILDAHKAARSY